MNVTTATEVADTMQHLNEHTSAIHSGADHPMEQRVSVGVNLYELEALIMAANHMALLARRDERAGDATLWAKLEDMLIGATK